MIKLLNRLVVLPLVALVPLAAGSLIWFQWAKGKLDSSYAASKHPVDYMTGQTSFSAERIKGYYSAMIDTGTLDIYVRTQLIDFGFILGFFGIGLFVCTLLARLGRAGSIGRKLGIGAGLAFVFGGLCDVIENCWSFVMLANPSGFADWLAIPYSLFAVSKFGLITLGMALFLASLVSIVLGRAWRKPKIG